MSVVMMGTEPSTWRVSEFDGARTVHSSARTRYAETRRRWNCGSIDLGRCLRMSSVRRTRRPSSKSWWDVGGIRERDRGRAGRRGQPRTDWRLPAGRRRLHPGDLAGVVNTTADRSRLTTSHGRRMGQARHRARRDRGPSYQFINCG